MTQPSDLSEPPAWLQTVTVIVKPAHKHKKSHVKTPKLPHPRAKKPKAAAHSHVKSPKAHSTLLSPSAAKQTHARRHNLGTASSHQHASHGSRRRHSSSSSSSRSKKGPVATSVTPGGDVTETTGGIYLIVAPDGTVSEGTIPTSTPMPPVWNSFGPNYQQTLTQGFGISGKQQGYVAKSTREPGDPKPTNENALAPINPATARGPFGRVLTTNELYTLMYHKAGKNAHAKADSKVKKGPKVGGHHGSSALHDVSSITYHAPAPPQLAPQEWRTTHLGHRHA